MSDPVAIGVFATVATTIVGGLVAAARAVVVRHLAALTRLEEQAQATALTQERTAVILDAQREHFVDLHRDADRAFRLICRIADAGGISTADRDTEPTKEPAEIPRAEPARRITGQHRATAASISDASIDMSGGRGPLIPEQ